jgi:hypothetical protein
MRERMFVVTEGRTTREGAMSATTIQIPADHVDAICQSLAGRRQEAERPEEIDSLLEQLAEPASESDPAYALRGSRALLWSAVYDALCAAAEQLAENCNELWRGDIAPDDIRAAIVRVESRYELLLGLGPPPGS